MEIKLKKLVQITFVLLSFSILIYASPASSTTFLSTDPLKIIDTNLGSGKTFTIKVNVTSVVDLYGYDFHLGYNTTVLTATSITVGPFFPDYFIWANEINDTAGYAWLGVMLPLGTPPPGINGSGVLATIAFSVDHYGDSVLDLYQTQLGNSTGDPILHDAYYGYFSNKILGDVNSDRRVDASDLSAFSKAYGSVPTKPSWNPECDFNRDDKVDASDLFDLSKNYGKTAP